MLKWKRKEAVVFDRIFHLIVNTVRKTAVAKASWLMLSSTLVFHLQNYWTCIVPSPGVHTPESNLRSMNFAYVVLRNGLGLGGAVVHSPTSPDYITFIFMHLADAFIQSDLQYIKAIHLLSVCVFPGNWTHDFCTAKILKCAFDVKAYYCIVSLVMHQDMYRIRNSYGDAHTNVQISFILPIYYIEVLMVAK